MTMSFDGELKTALFAGGGCTYGVVMLYVVRYAKLEGGLHSNVTP